MDKINSLILKYLSANASVEEETELLQWLKETDKNQNYFRSLKDLYDLAEFKTNSADSNLPAQWEKFIGSVQDVSTKPVITTRIYSLMRYAAIFTVGVLLSYFIYSSLDKEALTDESLLAVTQIETGAGERSKVTLPDGSTVWVNACSKISYDHTFGIEERAISLQGEAYFDVQTDTLKPFLVHTDLFTYRVTGTSFNVYSFSDEAEISIALLEGGVTIENGILSERLLPGELFIHNRVTNENTREQVNVDHVSSWRCDEFTFDYGLTFGELSKRLERMYDVEFIFDNKQASLWEFGGTLHNNYSLETILKIIQTSVPMKYTINENIVHIH